MNDSELSTHQMKYLELAYIYVNLASFNAVKAIKIYNKRHGIEDSPFLSKNACRVFRTPLMRKLISNEQKENQKDYKDQRDINIACLINIATDIESSTADKISAIKELNKMFGFYTTPADSITVIVE